LIRFEGVSKGYLARGSWHVVLDDVTFTVPPQSRIGILGANGSGKSSLLRLAAGGEEPDRGRIVREGRISFPVGFTGTFHYQLSGRENVAFLARLYGMDVDEVTGWIEHFVELGRYFDMPVGAYSSGMYARVALAASFAFDFDVYLVDEAIETGDAGFRRKCAAAFEERMQTASLLLVSHNVHTIRQYCQTGAVIHRGKVIGFPTIDEALHYYEMTLRQLEHQDG
jgi:capsular polysaccharide transport system ATP-binding protein